MNIIMQDRDRAAWITLDRPPLNVLNLPMLQEFQLFLNKLKDDNDVDLVVIRGAGERLIDLAARKRERNRARQQGAEHDRCADDMQEDREILARRSNRGEQLRHRACRPCR